MGRKKRNIVLEKIKLTDAGSLGKSISKKEGEKIIFTKNGVPGDIVDIRVRKKRKSYLEGDIIKYHKYSPKRTEPKCSHFELCGGCSWQNMNYENQLKYKDIEVTENLNRIGKTKGYVKLPIIKSEKTSGFLKTGKISQKIIPCFGKSL